MTLSLRKVRLGTGWLAVPVVLWLARPSLPLIAVGAILVGLGALIRAWAAGTIQKNEVLATAGPYAHTRNPLYLGSFLIGLGVAIASGHPLVVAAVVVFFVWVYAPTMRREEIYLERKFGSAYREYAARVPLFLPRLRPYRREDAAPGRFRLARYLGHGEYKAGLGALLFLLALAAKLVID